MTRMERATPVGVVTRAGAVTRVARVLVAAGDRLLGDFLVDALGELGYAASADAATDTQRRARALQPALVLLADPTPTAATAVGRALRADPWTVHIPLVAIAAPPLAAAAPADAHLPLPFELDDLARCLGRWAGAPRHGARARVHPWPADHPWTDG